MLDRDAILKVLEEYPVPSELQAGLAGKIAQMVVKEFIAGWRREDQLNSNEISADMTRLQATLQSWQLTLQQIQHVEIAQQWRDVDVAGPQRFTMNPEPSQVLVNEGQDIDEASIPTFPLGGDRRE